MLIACRDNHIKRFIFAASSSTYGDSNFLPKIEEKIGNPLSPYAITNMSMNFMRKYLMIYTDWNILD